jgi:hypothetical protein
VSARASRQGPGFDPYAPGRWARRVPIRRLPVRCWRTGAGELVSRGVAVRTQRTLLYAMTTLCDPDGSNIRMSVPTLADFADCDERTARAGLRSLEQQGLIRADRRSNGGRRSSSYSLVMGPQAVPTEPPIPGHGAPVTPANNQDTAVPPLRGHSCAPPPALDPSPPLTGPPSATDEDEPARAGAHRQPAARGRRPGCIRHPSRARPNCRDCRPTPIPRTMAPAATPPPGTAARGAAAVRDAIAAAGLERRAVSGAITRSKRGAK